MRFVALYFVIIFSFCQFGFSQNDLNYYISAAKVNSPLIQDNKNQSAAAKIEAERIKAVYTKPQVTFMGSLSFSPIISQDSGKTKLVFSPSDAIKYVGYDIAASNGGVYMGLINVNQPLFNNSKYKTAAEQALIGARINENNIQISGHDIEKIVGDQYILCFQDMKQIDYLNNLIELIKEQKTSVTKLAEDGLLKQSDMLLVNIEYQTQLNMLNYYNAVYKRDLMDLNILCGINDTSYVAIKDINLAVNPNITFSKFTEKFRLDSLNLVASQKIFELKYKSQLSAFGNAGLNGVYVPTLPNRFGMSAGLNFTVYIFDGKQKSLNQKKTDILIKSTQAYKSNFVTQNTIRKSKLLTEISSLEARMAIASAQLKDYKQLLEFYKKELMTGQQSVVLYITTVKGLATLQRDYVLMQTNKQLLINTYNYWNW
ncbi:MAG TPA: TolC family protein [Bacteroidia bacterium]|nr:TolC family protein [Bacteroidia bacterium]